MNCLLLWPDIASVGNYAFGSDPRFLSFEQNRLRRNRNRVPNSCLQKLKFDFFFARLFWISSNLGFLIIS